MLPSVVIIEDALGPRQRRKLFSIACTDEGEMDVSTDEEAPAEMRTCKQCNNGNRLLECHCEESEAYRTIRRQMTAKRSLSVDWDVTLDVLEGFLHIKKTKDAGRLKERNGRNFDFAHWRQACRILKEPCGKKIHIAHWSFLIRAYSAKSKSSSWSASWRYYVDAERLWHGRRWTEVREQGTIYFAWLPVREQKGSRNKGS